MLSFLPRDVLDEIFDLIESVSEGFPTNSRNFTGIFLFFIGHSQGIKFTKMDRIWPNYQMGPDCAGCA